METKPQQNHKPCQDLSIHMVKNEVCEILHKTIPKRTSFLFQKLVAVLPKAKRRIGVPVGWNRTQAAPNFTNNLDQIRLSCTCKQLFLPHTQSKIKILAPNFQMKQAINGLISHALGRNGILLLFPWQVRSEGTESPRPRTATHPHPGQLQEAKMTPWTRQSKNHQINDMKSKGECSLWLMVSCRDPAASKLPWKGRRKGPRLRCPKKRPPNNQPKL